MWYRINGDLINLSRVVNIYICGEKELVFVLDVPVAGSGAGGGAGYSIEHEFDTAESVIKFSNKSNRDKCFNKLAEVLGAKTLDF